MSSPLDRAGDNGRTVFPGVASPHHFHRYGSLPRFHEGYQSAPLVMGRGPEEDYQQCDYGRVAVIRLWEPEDCRKYDEIMNQIAAGAAVWRYEHPQYVPDRQSWIILLAWMDNVLELPRDGLIVNGGPDDKPIGKSTGAIGERVYR